MTHPNSTQIMLLKSNQCYSNQPSPTKLKATQTKINSSQINPAVWTWKFSKHKGNAQAKLTWKQIQYIKYELLTWKEHIEHHLDRSFNNLLLLQKDSFQNMFFFLLYSDILIFYVCYMYTLFMLLISCAATYTHNEFITSYSVW